MFFLILALILALILSATADCFSLFLPFILSATADCFSLFFPLHSLRHGGLFLTLLTIFALKFFYLLAFRNVEKHANRVI